MKPIRFEGARVILPDGIHETEVTVGDGVILEIGGTAGDARAVDARGCVLGPAMVDIHGDAFERQLMPRPGVHIPVGAAMLDTDRQLAANGIATAYHALTLSWEPGLRSVGKGAEVIAALEALDARLTVDNRVQLRWETFCFEAVPLIEQALVGPRLPSIAFNDHTSMALLHPGTPLQRRPFEHAADYPLADPTTPEFEKRMTARAERSGLSPKAYVALLRKVWDRRPAVPGAIADVAAKGRAAGAPMLSHDDTQDETRAFYRGMGAAVSEFPMNRTTASGARDGGDVIVFGAPNAARGGSHLGSPGAAEMVADGLCDVLASDYHYPSMLAAVARLVAERAGDLSTIWRLVAENPARASGLSDRGRIAAGLRADLVLIDWPEDGVPVPRMTLSGGRVAYRAEPAGA